MTDYATGIAPLHLLEWASPTNLPLHANVEFGVLQSDGECVRLGICRINTTHYYDMINTRLKRRQCPIAGAKLHVSPQGRLLVFFPKKGMLPCTEREFFRQPVFPVPVAYFLPEDVREGLPALEQIIIPAGLYPIRQSVKGYWVEF